MSVVGPPPSVIAGLVATHRVLITVGAGGVGKTTTAAAVALAAATRGKRVLCLTIDPARRLAQSLGLQHMTTEAVEVPHDILASVGVPETGSLTVMMLDTKQTFDELVRKYSSTQERAERLLNNRLYQYVSASLAGTQEYMAMEKLVAVQGDSRFDLIVLDTPPTANALDFLDAPDRLVDALDSPTMRWFIEAFQSTGRFSLNVLARSAALVLRALGRVTGGGFLEALAELLAQLNDLFGGFKERAAMVKSVLRSDEVSFLLVTSPAPMSIREVRFFSERLVEHEMPRGAFIVNRVRMHPKAAHPTDQQVDDALKGHGLATDVDLRERICRAHADAVKLAELDAFFLRELALHAEEHVPVLRVPEFATDVHDVAMLARVARTLEAGGV
jgi:anion-transporting  ArsA/GET3 family ATPase